MAKDMEMANVIDVISVNPKTGFVELAVIDDRSWDSYSGHMQWLIEKLNLYIGYVFSGQIKSNPDHANRPVKFVVHFNGRPPKEARAAMQRVRDHLGAQQVVFAVTETGDVTAEVDIDRWHELEAGAKNGT